MTSCESAAAKHELVKPDVLRAQTERMLNDQKSRRFVEAVSRLLAGSRKIVGTSHGRESLFGLLSG